MTAIRRTSFALLLAVVAVSAGHAAPARDSSPFDDLDSIHISIEVGGPLDLEGNTGRALLANDLRRFNRFQSSLRRALVNQVESCGLLVDPGAMEQIAVEVFGRPEPRPQGPPPNHVFLVEISAFSLDPKDRDADPQLVVPRRVLGLADDANLETAVIDAALAALPEDLRFCEEG